MTEINLTKKLRLALAKKDKELQELREQLAMDLERQATYAMISDEYNFNDTAVRAKTYYHAAQVVRGEFGERKP